MTDSYKDIALAKANDVLEGEDFMLKGCLSVCPQL